MPYLEGHFWWPIEKIPPGVFSKIASYLESEGFKLKDNKTEENDHLLEIYRKNKDENDHYYKECSDLIDKGILNGRESFAEMEKNIRKKYNNSILVVDNFYELNFSNPILGEARLLEDVNVSIDSSPDEKVPNVFEIYWIIDDSKFFDYENDGILNWDNLNLFESISFNIFHSYSVWLCQIYFEFDHCVFPSWASIVKGEWPIDFRTTTFLSKDVIINYKLNVSKPAIKPKHLKNGGCSISTMKIPWKEYKTKYLKQ